MFRRFRNWLLVEILTKLVEIQLQLKHMASELETLKTEVAETTTVQQSAIVLLKGLKQRLDDAIASGDPAELTKLSASLDKGQADLAAAISENTPAE